MKAEEIPVARLFESGKQIRVPLWQRRYRWESPQLAELWDDLDRLGRGLEPVHFLGSVVLHRLRWDGMPSEAQPFLIVDGQQRVATLTLLLCAIRDTLLERNPDQVAAERNFRQFTELLLVNGNLTDDHRERLVLQERDQVALRAIIDRTGDDGVESRIEKAYRFFRAKLADVELAAVEALVGVIQTKIHAVWVTLEAQDNAHRVFQTLNAGGKQLDPADLVRNYFFLLLGDRSDEFYSTHWRSMEAELGSQLESFLIAWSVSQGYGGVRDKLFEDIQRDLRGRELNVDEVFTYGLHLVDASRLFRGLHAPDTIQLPVRVRQTLTDLKNWSTKPYEGLLLWLLRQRADDHLDDKQLGRAFEIVLSFVARRQLAGYEPNLHRSIFNKVARKCHQSGFTGTDVVDFIHLVLSEDNDVRSWPTNDQILRSCGVTPVYSKARRAWAFTILERIDRELYLHPEHAPQHIDRNAYSVEHILPQTLSKSWRTDLNSWGEVNPVQLHQERLHVLGNLTLTPINPKLGNKQYVAKRDALTDDSLRLNHFFAGPQLWTRAQIDERSQELARLACKSFVPPLKGDALARTRVRLESVPGSPLAREGLLAVELELDAEEDVE